MKVTFLGTGAGEPTPGRWCSCPACEAARTNGGRDVRLRSAALINDDAHFDFHMFKAVGLFYALPIFVIYLFFQNKLMTIYGGGTKG